MIRIGIYGIQEGLKLSIGKVFCDLIVQLGNFDLEGEREIRLRFTPKLMVRLKSSITRAAVVCFPFF